MYEIRFGEAPPVERSIDQLRDIEGVRVHEKYRQVVCMHGRIVAAHLSVAPPTAGLRTNVLRTIETFSHQAQILILQTLTVILESN
jgi:hypothetical protein